MDEPDVYERDGIVYYRASSLGGCVRRLALARQGFEPMPPSAAMLEVFEAGNEAERQVWAKGIVKGYAQHYVELVISDSIRVSGHLDCWDSETHGPTEWTGRVYEIKSQSEAEWKPIEQSPLWYRYKFQISCYMHATGLPLTLVRVQRRKDGSIAFEERQDYQQAPVSLAEIRAKIFRVELLARRELNDVECEKVEFPCPFYYTHVSKEAVREQVDDPGAVVLAKQYAEARQLANAANSRVKASRAALLEYVGDRKRLELSDGTLLTRYQVKEQEVSYTRQAYWTLRVTSPKENDEGEAGADSV